MAINHHFQGGNGIGNTNEKKLYEDLIIEGLKIYGHDVYYLPRTLVNQDLILGEDSLSKFDDSYLIEMYVETTEGLAGEQELINKFGLEIREETTFMLSTRALSRSLRIFSKFLNFIKILISLRFGFSFPRIASSTDFERLYESGIRSSPDRCPKEGVSPLSNSCVGVENEDAKLWSCCFSESKILPKSMK